MDNNEQTTQAPTAKNVTVLRKSTTTKKKKKKALSVLIQDAPPSSPSTTRLSPSSLNSSLHSEPSTSTATSTSFTPSVTPSPLQFGASVVPVSLPNSNQSSGSSTSLTTPPSTAGTGPGTTALSSSNQSTHSTSSSSTRTGFGFGSGLGYGNDAHEPGANGIGTATTPNVTEVGSGLVLPDQFASASSTLPSPSASSISSTSLASSSVTSSTASTTSHPTTSSSIHSSSSSSITSPTHTTTPTHSSSFSTLSSNPSTSSTTASSSTTNSNSISNLSSPAFKKQTLLLRSQAAIKEVIRVGRETIFTNENSKPGSVVAELIAALAEVLSHRLRPLSSGGLFGALVGDFTPATPWELLRQVGRCLPGTEETVLGKIKRLPNCNTELGKAVDGALGDYLKALAWDSDLLHTIYFEDAFLRDDEHLGIFLALVDSLCTLKFSFVLNTIQFDSFLSQHQASKPAIAFPPKMDDSQAIAPPSTSIPISQPSLQVESEPLSGTSAPTTSSTATTTSFVSSLIGGLTGGTSATTNSSASEEEKEMGKATLLKDLQQAIKYTIVAGQKNLIYDDNPAAHMICRSVERLISHGLKESFLGVFLPWDVFQNLAKLLTGTESILNQIKKLNNVTTDVGRGRAVIRHALSYGLLHEFLSTLFTTDQGKLLLPQYYYPHAFVCDEDNMEIALGLCGTLQQIRFSLRINDSQLDKATFWTEALNKDQGVAAISLPSSGTSLSSSPSAQEEKKLTPRSAATTPPLALNQDSKTSHQLSTTPPDHHHNDVKHRLTESQEITKPSKSKPSPLSISPSKSVNQNGHHEVVSLLTAALKEEKHQEQEQHSKACEDPNADGSFSEMLEHISERKGIVSSPEPIPPVEIPESVFAEMEIASLSPPAVVVTPPSTSPPTVLSDMPVHLPTASVSPRASSSPIGVPATRFAAFAPSSSTYPISSSYTATTSTSPSSIPDKPNSYTDSKSFMESDQGDSSDIIFQRRTARRSRSTSPKPKISNSGERLPAKEKQTEDDDREQPSKRESGGHEGTALSISPRHYSSSVSPPKQTVLLSRPATTSSSPPASSQNSSHASSLLYSSSAPSTSYFPPSVTNMTSNAPISVAKPVDIAPTPTSSASQKSTSPSPSSSSSTPDSGYQSFSQLSTSYERASISPPSVSQPSTTPPSTTIATSTSTSTSQRTTSAVPSRPVDPRYRYLEPPAPEPLPFGLGTANNDKTKTTKTKKTKKPKSSQHSQQALPRVHKEEPNRHISAPQVSSRPGSVASLDDILSIKTPLRVGSSVTPSPATTTTTTAAAATTTSSSSSSSTSSFHQSTFVSLPASLTQPLKKDFPSDKVVVLTVAADDQDLFASYVLDNFMFAPEEPKRHDEFTIDASRETAAEEEYSDTMRRFKKQIFYEVFERENANKKEQQLCSGCSVRLPVGLESSRRFCHYTGKFYCVNCHKNKKHIIPGRILRLWDLESYPVSNMSFDFLKLLYEEPLFDIGSIAPDLYDLKPIFRQLQVKRQILWYMKDFILTCASKNRPNKLLFSPHSHLIFDTEKYSLKDFVDISNGTFIPILNDFYEQFSQHISRCQLCKMKGWICEFCNSKQPIYPFQLAEAAQCPKCKSFYHQKCFRNARCPKCLRLAEYEKRKAQRKQMEERSMMLI